MEIKRVVAANFNGGYNCAQAVISGFVDRYGVGREEAFRLADGLGGGLKGGHTCGAAVGGVIVIGLAFGASAPTSNEGESLSAAKTKEFMAGFEKIAGQINCSEILGKTPEQRGKLSEEEKAEDRAFCTGLVERTAELLIAIGC